MLVAALGWYDGERALKELQKGVLDALPQILEPEPLRWILSISSMKTMPCWAAPRSPLAAWINRDNRLSTSSPTYPASVRLVASPMTSGTLRYEARDLTKWVAASAGTDEQDVGLLHDHIPKVGVGDDRIRSATIPDIDETLVVVGNTKSKSSLGDSLPDHKLVQVGDQGLGRWDRGEESFLRWASGSRAGSGTG